MGSGVNEPRLATTDRAEDLPMQQRTKRSRETGTASRLLGSSLGLAFLAGCTLLAGLEGLEGPPTIDDAGEQEAAAFEAAPRDALTPDAAVDCAAPSFCDDFERADLQGNWSSVVSTGTAMVLDTSQARSLSALKAAPSCFHPSSPILLRPCSSA